MRLRIIMSVQFKSFYVLANEIKDPNLEKSKAIQQFLELRGKKCGCAAIKRYYDDENELKSIAAKIPSSTDCIVVLGGDGTLIQVAGLLSNRNIPILGVNMGNLGFLAEVEKDSVFDALERVLKGEYLIDDRMMLSGGPVVSGITLNSIQAVNDIAIARNGRLKVARFNIFVNDEPLYSVCADGIILSTPTGSTAYNLSAGGPIVAPYSECIILTPICAHSINLRPVVLSKDDVIKVVLDTDTGKSDTEFEAYFDGAITCPLNKGDSVVIKKSYATAKFIRFDKTNFVAVLSRKMAEDNK